MKASSVRVVITGAGVVTPLGDSTAELWTRLQSGASAVRDFRGAMAGRGDKGLLITTGTFTSEAKMEATRDGAPPIDLIDGDRLCDLLKDYEVGVRVTVRQIEDVTIDGAFFEQRLRRAGDLSQFQRARHNAGSQLHAAEIADLVRSRITGETAAA